MDEVPPAEALPCEETQVADPRAMLSPSQRVEQSLIDALKAAPLLVSQIQRRLILGPPVNPQAPGPLPPAPVRHRRTGRPAGPNQSPPRFPTPLRGLS